MTKKRSLKSFTSAAYLLYIFCMFVNGI